LLLHYSASCFTTEAKLDLICFDQSFSHNFSKVVTVVTEKGAPSFV
jgi:hypothetical protein